MQNTSIHIFRRDLRIQDNSSLIKALGSSEQVLPCFILDERQLSNNPYHSKNALQFMIESLKDLDRQLKEMGGRLYLFQGIAEEVVAKLLSSVFFENKISNVSVNRDYTPFSMERDEKIQAVCEKNGVTFHSCADALLLEPELVEKKTGGPYTIFTPFHRAAKDFMVMPPGLNSFTNYFIANIPESADLPDSLSISYLDTILPEKNTNLRVKGGRKEAGKILNQLASLADYSTLREVPHLDGTSHLSAHHKFGTVSIREVYHKVRSLFGGNHQFLTELYWRDFLTHIAFHFPHVFAGPFKKQYQNIQWSQNSTHFKAWQQGLTGFPIVDAGMRELNATGFMHNRVRMITASFLCKDLHINWREGEKYFAQKLVDYDPAVNNGNWQWAASTGCDAQPYFRIFNPWRQIERFDPECLYIKKWVPELKELTPKEILKLETTAHPADPAYPRPIVIHKQQAEIAKALFRGNGNL